MFYLYLLLVTLLVLVTFHIATRHSRKGRLLRKIHGPIPYPIFGNTLLFQKYSSCSNQFWEVGRRICNEYRPITRFWFFTTAAVSIGHPDDLEILLTSQKVLEKGYVYDYLRPWLKNGLLTSAGDLWRQRRKILTPAFHFNILKKYIEITNEEGRKAVAELKLDGRESIQALEDFCSKYALNIITESAMGVKLSSESKKSSDDYRNSIHNMGKIAFFRTPRPYVFDWMMPYLYKWGTLQRNAINCLHSFSKKIIEERIEYHKSNDNKLLFEEVEGAENMYEDNIGSKKRLAMLDLLLAAKEKNEIDFNGIQEEVDTFTFEGHDTSGMALVFALFLLAEHKEAQEKCREEAIELLEKTDGNLQLSDLQELPYLERCIKESLRMYPPVATLLRYTREDIQLKHALVPSGTHLFIHLYDTHRYPGFWEEPEKFDPDRFLPENCKERHPYAYVPFSAGPRNCIGQKFAMMELKSLIARLLYDFRLEPIDRIADMKLSADIILRPFKPVRIKFISIKK